MLVAAIAALILAHGAHAQLNKTQAAAVSEYLTCSRAPGADALVSSWDAFKRYAPPAACIAYTRWLSSSLHASDLARKCVCRHTPLACETDRSLTTRVPLPS